MTTERHHILEMLAEKKVTIEEAEKLLGAIRPARSRVGDWLFRPIERLQTRTAVVVAIAVALAQLLVSRLGIRFDGALDSHLSPDGVPFSTALLDLALGWLVVSAIVWAAARLVARQGRFVDFVVAIGVARLPLVASGAIVSAVRPSFERAAAGTPDLGFVVFSIVTLALVVWFFVLLATGMRTASGLRGLRLGLTATVSLLVAEAVTKILLASL